MSEKNQLQEYAQKNKYTLPTYTVVEEGPPHLRKYKGCVELAGRKYEASTTAQTKKEAERLAALRALEAVIAAVKPVPTTKPNEVTQSDMKTPVSMPLISKAAYVQKLQEYLQKLKLGGPKFNIVQVPGSEDHAPKFFGDLTFEVLDPETKNQVTMIFRVDTHEASSTKKDVQQLLAEKAMLAITQQIYRTNTIKARSHQMDVKKDIRYLGVPITKSTARNYQIELFHQAAEKNVICCLPTGAGKTLIACMLIKQMKTANPEKRIVFLVDRIPLVFQQAAAIEKETGLTALRCCGDTFTKTQLDRPYDVIVVIASLYINLLNLNLVSLREVSLIVVDEAHHITKDHPFAVILRDWYWKLESNLKPKVLGLTASPAGEENFLGTFLRLRMLTETADAAAVTPTKYEKELESYTTFQQLEIHELEISPTEYLLRGLLDYIESQLGSHFYELSRSASVDSLGSGVKDLDFDDEEERIVYQGPPNLKVERPGSPKSKKPTEFLYTELKSLLVQLEDYGQIVDKRNKQIVDIRAHIIERINTYGNFPEKAELERRCHIGLTSDTTHKLNMAKGEALLEVLRNIKRKDSTAIIFVQERESATKMVEFLKARCEVEEQLSWIQPIAITGHTSKGADGMTIARQQKAIEAFTTGKANFLVGTSVVEEGFNVPECNLVIRLDPPSTVTALVQSRGRLRHRDSKFIAIVKSEERNTYEKLVRQEEFLKLAVRFMLNPNIALPPLPPKSVVSYATKTSIQEVEESCQKCSACGFPLKLEEPKFLISGPPHSPFFKAKLVLQSLSDATLNQTVENSGYTKQEAREKAANELIRSHAFPKLLVKMTMDKEAFAKKRETSLTKGEPFDRYGFG